MRKIIISVTAILFLLTIPGCLAIVPSYIIERSEEICKDRGGIYHIDTSLFMYSVKCLDGTEHNTGVKNNP